MTEQKFEPVAWRWRLNEEINKPWGPGPWECVRTEAECHQASFVEREPLFTAAQMRQAEREALEEAAKMLEKLADDFAGEYGHDDMGALSFGQGSHAYEKMDRYTDMKDYAESIRALLEAPLSSEKERS